MVPLNMTCLQHVFFEHLFKLYSNDPSQRFRATLALDVKEANVVDQAVELLIAKYKAFGGMPYNDFTKLYDSTVWPVIAYVASVWGN